MFVCRPTHKASCQEQSQQKLYVNICKTPPSAGPGAFASNISRADLLKWNTAKMNGTPASFPTAQSVKGNTHQKSDRLFIVKIQVRTTWQPHRRWTATPQHDCLWLQMNSAQQAEQRMLNLSTFMLHCSDAWWCYTRQSCSAVMVMTCSDNFCLFVSRVNVKSGCSSLQIRNFVAR